MADSKPKFHSNQFALDLRAVRKSYGTTPALKGVDLTVRSGEFVTILGPSGSGKTSLLKIIAGFELLDSGDVLVDGREVTYEPASVRDIGMVFQNFALFPHLTVERNVAFPLEMRKTARAETRERVQNALALVGLGDFGKRYPRELSGGQQQRVALARAIVFEPKLLLLDEPFSALDRKLREAMQIEVKELQHRLGLTTIFITHDQEEALIMSDRVAVMGKGVIRQLSTPHELYHRPASLGVAEFVGESNLFHGDLIRSGASLALRTCDGIHIELADGAGQSEHGASARVLIRPEAVQMAGSSQEDGGNVLQATIENVMFSGPTTKYLLRTSTGHSLISRTSTDSAASYAVGDVVRVVLPPFACRLLPEAAEGVEELT